MTALQAVYASLPQPFYMRQTPNSACKVGQLPLYPHPAMQPLAQPSTAHWQIYGGMGEADHSALQADFSALQAPTSLELRPTESQPLAELQTQEGCAVLGRPRQRKQAQVQPPTMMLGSLPELGSLPMPAMSATPASVKPEGAGVVPQDNPLVHTPPMPATAWAPVRQARAMRADAAPFFPTNSLQKASTPSAAFSSVTPALGTDAVLGGASTVSLDKVPLQGAVDEFLPAVGNYAAPAGLAQV